MEFRNKKAAILGYGAEGRAAEEFLRTEGATVEIFDDKLNMGSGRELKDFDVVLRSPGVSLSNHWIKEAVTAGVPITSGTAIFLERSPAPVIGVTGTKGKGTTASWIYEMLKAAGKKTELIGNIGQPALSVLPRLTPDIWVVYELSSFQLLEITKSPHIAVVLMVTQDHLDFHGTLEEYERAKKKIVEFQAPEDFVVANKDYPSPRRIAESSRAKKIWVSRADAANWNYEIALPGAHNLENAAAAVAVAHILELPEEAIASTLKNFHGLPHRLQLIAEKEGVKFYDDSISTTPESTIAAIKAFKESKVLILGGSSKGADFGQLGQVLAGDPTIRAIVGVGEEWPKIKFSIFNYEFLSKPPEIIEGCKNMEEIVRAAQRAARPGDVVILSPACASFDMFKSYADRGEQFVKAILSS